MTDWLRYLITRFEPGDGPQAQMVEFMRSLFSAHVISRPMLKSVAVSDAGMTKQMLYEVVGRHLRWRPTTARWNCLIPSMGIGSAQI